MPRYEVLVLKSRNWYERQYETDIPREAEAKAWLLRKQGFRVKIIDIIRSWHN